MNFKSLRDLTNDIQSKLLPVLPRDISVVYGIPRSGMIPAAILATALGAELAAIGDTPTAGSRRKHKVLPEGGKALLVDDSIHTGKAMTAARALVGNGGVDYTCAVYAYASSTRCIDFFAEILEGPRMFEWNFTGIKASEGYC